MRVLCMFCTFYMCFVTDPYGGHAIRGWHGTTSEFIVCWNHVLCMIHLCLMYDLTYVLRLCYVCSMNGSCKCCVALYVFEYLQNI